MKLQRILLKNSKYKNHWFPVEELTDDQIIEVISQETVAEINDSEEEIAVISNTEALDSIEKLLDIVKTHLIILILKWKN